MFLSFILNGFSKLPVRLNKMYLMHKINSFESHMEYEEAVIALNGLQSNKNAVIEARKRIAEGRQNSLNLELTRKYLERCGVKLNLLERKIIHVTGTKGKGSTCALCEGILRSHGFKTGFFSSPHIIAVRERIRINGKPISRLDFVSYFWPLYNKFMSNQEYEHDMPSYFKFLTIMALNVFIEENVDVAIIEVGIGGEFDCTNVFKQTPVVGITNIGLDHTKLLGGTVESIAWQKGGIMKPNCTAFSALLQPASALSVLKERAIEKKCTFSVVPELRLYKWTGSNFDPSSISTFHTLNASLAIQLAHSWIEKQGMVPSMVKTEEGLTNTKWLGRFQILTVGEATFYLDGAHTVESNQLCIDWFKSVAKSSGSKRILVFNTTGSRNSEALLCPLLSCNFTTVIFCPNVVTCDPAFSPPDLYYMKCSHDTFMEKCKMHKTIWDNFEENSKSLVLPSVSDTLELIGSHGRVDVLITGSIHLVGCALFFLEPSLSS